MKEKRLLIAIGIGCWCIGIGLVQLSHLLPSDTMDQCIIRSICMILGIVVFGYIGFGLFIISLIGKSITVEGEKE